MTAHVISHRGPRGKRALSSWAGRQLVLLAITLAALAAGTWIVLRGTQAISAPRQAPGAQRERPEMPAETPTIPPAPSGPAPASAPHAWPMPAPIPLDTPVGVDPYEGLEVLSAAELARISQARDVDGAPQFAAEGQAATAPREEPRAGNGEDQGGQSRRRTRRR